MNSEPVISGQIINSIKASIIMKWAFCYNDSHLKKLEILSWILFMMKRVPIGGYWQFHVAGNFFVNNKPSLITLLKWLKWFVITNLLSWILLKKSVIAKLNNYSWWKSNKERYHWVWKCWVSAYLWVENKLRFGPIS